MFGATFPNYCDLTGDDSIDDLFAPIPIGRLHSGTESPSSLEPKTSTPAIATTNVSDRIDNSSTEDTSISFPIVLYAVVSNDSPCIHWLACGTRFVIADKEEFSQNVLPKHFDGRGGATTKFTSFTRRLKRWNFSRIPSGREMGAYFHPNFRRGHPELAENLTYPINNTKSLPVIKEKKRPGKSAVSRARAFPNAGRRASTGSIIPSEALSRPVTSDTEPLDAISPTPIRATVRAKEDGSILPLTMLQREMKNWLSSVDFTEDGGSLENSFASAGAVPASVISSTPHFLPPPPFPNNVMSGRFQRGGSEMKPLSIRPAELMRRHSVTMDSGATSMMCMPMMATSSNDTNASIFSQFLAVRNPEVTASAINNTSFVSDKKLPVISKKNTQPKGVDDIAHLIGSTTKRQPQCTVGGAYENLEDLLDPLRGFCVDEMIDPFT